MRRGFRRVAREDQGQNLVPYSLLIAFICLASVFLLVSVGSNIKFQLSFSRGGLNSPQAYKAPDNVGPTMRIASSENRDRGSGSFGPEDLVYGGIGIGVLGLYIWLRSRFKRRK